MQIADVQRENGKADLMRFLSWLLDARFFPETDHSVKNKNRAELRRFKGILKRMEGFVEDVPDERLKRGIAEWKSYEPVLKGMTRQMVRSSPIMQITSVNSKANQTVALNLLCASRIIPKLWPGEDIYRKMKQFLAEPAKLPYDTAQSGRQIERRPYHMSEKALQSSVQRIRGKIRARRTAFGNEVEVLEQTYGLYRWTSMGKAGFSDSEKEMLSSLVTKNSAKQNKKKMKEWAEV